MLDKKFMFSESSFLTSEQRQQWDMIESSRTNTCGETALTAVNGDLWSFCSFRIHFVLFLEV